MMIFFLLLLNHNIVFKPIGFFEGTQGKTDSLTSTVLEGAGLQMLPVFLCSRRRRWRCETGGSGETFHQACLSNWWMDTCALQRHGSRIQTPTVLNGTQTLSLSRLETLATTDAAVFSTGKKLSRNRRRLIADSRFPTSWLGCRRGGLVSLPPLGPDIGRWQRTERGK